MKKLDIPIYGGTLPIFFEGTLEDKYSELLTIQERVDALKENPDARPSESLLDERGELELEISRHLTNGDVLTEDVFMDYCLRHFNGGTTGGSINGRRERDPSVFDRIDNVKNFMDYIPGMKGKKILHAYGDVPGEAGIIAGDPYFAVEGCFRYMRIPVKQLFHAEKEKWAVGRKQWNPKKEEAERVNDYFTVPAVVFEHPGETGKHGIWSSNMAGIEWVGAVGGPENTSVYVGNGNVDNLLFLGGEKGDTSIVMPFSN